MSLDNLNQEIERRASISGSYIETIKEFCIEKEIPDFEDLTEQLHPILIDKIKAEFEQKNFFPNKKRGEVDDSFFD